MSFYAGYLFTVLSLIVFAVLSWAVHTFMDLILLWFPAHESARKAYLNSIVKFTTLVIGVVYPGIKLLGSHDTFRIEFCSASFQSIVMLTIFWQPFLCVRYRCGTVSWLAINIF